jgi:probable addiction module antidote protein
MPERIAAYLEVALKDGNAGMLKVALGSIARSKGVAEIAEQADVSRQALYRALSRGSEPFHPYLRHQGVGDQTARCGGVILSGGSSLGGRAGD